jgi:hypothetical protein
MRAGTFQSEEQGQKKEPFKKLLTHMRSISYGKHVSWKPKQKNGLQSLSGSLRHQSQPRVTFFVFRYIPGNASGVVNVQQLTRRIGQRRESIQLDAFMRLRQLKKSGKWKEQEKSIRRNRIQTRTGFDHWSHPSEACKFEPHQFSLIAPRSCA